ncbi:uncharacterized protein Dwil_GK18979 [Drosophila willistoni]|uniref:Uncharacterized protein n=1 Tax=Drosophila willistoni TaxID=7260 RepID=B4NHS2_DROWI|nr:uncharacterized protein Dwil_GK18979 [Drosophila willistoni]
MASDHKAILCTIEGRRRYDRPTARPQRYNTKRMDMQNFTSTLVQNVNTATSARGLFEWLRNACESSMPRKNTCPREHIPTYWWNDEIANLRKECHIARRRHQRNRVSDDCETLRIEFEQKRRDLKLAIRRSKRRCFNDLLVEAENDVWGRPYKIVMKRLKTNQRTEPHSVDDMDRIVGELFPPQPPTNSPAAPMDVETIPPISVRELLAAVARTRVRSSPGLDCIPNEALKIAAYQHPDIFAYVAVSMMEILILYISNRRSKRLTFSMRFNVFTNFRFLRAILGQSFPFGRRASFSLKHLMIAISVFGMIFSSFFGSKLSTLLTVYPKSEHIKNFKELRDENLTVVFDIFTAIYTRNNIDAEFFQKTLPNSWIVTPKERIEMIYSLNTSYAYQIYSEPWLTLKDINQKHRIFCTTPELRIVENAALFANFEGHCSELHRKYISWTMSVGLFKYWFENSLEKEKASIRYIPTDHVLPLDLQCLKWAWYLLAIGYILSMCIFLFEICLGRRQRRVVTLP